MPKAPNGAVIKIDSTATVRTICPQANPIASGSPPIAACTVALGMYAIMQKDRSLADSSVFHKQRKTPAMRKTRTPNISKIAAGPALNAYPMSTVAPTRTKSRISAPTYTLTIEKSSIIRIDF